MPALFYTLYMISILNKSKTQLFMLWPHTDFRYRPIPAAQARVRNMPWTKHRQHGACYVNTKHNLILGHFHNLQIKKVGHRLQRGSVGRAPGALRPMRDSSLGCLSSTLTSETAEQPFPAPRSPPHQNTAIKISAELCYRLTNKMELNEDAA